MDYELVALQSIHFTILTIYNGLNTSGDISQGNSTDLNSPSHFVGPMMTQWILMSIV